MAGKKSESPRHLSTAPTPPVSLPRIELPALSKTLTNVTKFFNHLAAAAVAAQTARRENRRQPAVHGGLVSEALPRCVQGCVNPLFRCPNFDVSVGRTAGPGLLRAYASGTFNCVSPTTRDRLEQKPAVPVSCPWRHNRTHEIFRRTRPIPLFRYHGRVACKC